MFGSLYGTGALSFVGSQYMNAEPGTAPAGFQDSFDGGAFGLNSIGPDEAIIQCHPGSGCTATPIEDFIEGVLRGALDESLAASRAGVAMLACGKNPFCLVSMMNNLPRVHLGAPDSNVGRLGYEGSAVVIAAGAGGVGAARALLSRLAARGAAGATEAFHYTFSRALASIQSQGLRQGSYATPNGTMSPLQAHIDLALPANRGLPDALVRIDLAGLRKAGYQIPEATRVGRNSGMPGGGFEMQFPYPIPPQFIKVIRP